jgi:hypothetical protein
MFGDLGFYKYANRDGGRIMGDLNDGYYPFILKDKYPNGVVMNISFFMNLMYKKQ